MRYKITAKSEFLVAQLFDRDTAEETQEFLRAVVLENKTQRRRLVLLDIRSSRPLFHDPERLRLFDDFKELLFDRSCKLALLGDTKELCISHEYLTLLAQQRGLNVRSFRDRVVAFKWLHDRRQREERRHKQGRRSRQEEERRRQQALSQQREERRRRQERRYQWAERRRWDRRLGLAGHLST
jgi:hypothetical protein